jgi:hypothetical protein
MSRAVVGSHAMGGDVQFVIVALEMLVPTKERQAKKQQGKQGTTDDQQVHGVAPYQALFLLF